MQDINENISDLDSRTTGSIKLLLLPVAISTLLLAALIIT
jgi:hypothetical protein